MVYCRFGQCGRFDSIREGVLMDDEQGHGRRALRQWSVSLSESSRSPSLGVVLRWRAFPCGAQHWDGVMYAEVPWDGGPITSQEALREALRTAAETPWTMRPGTRA